MLSQHLHVPAGFWGRILRAAVPCGEPPLLGGLQKQVQAGGLPASPCPQPFFLCIMRPESSLWATGSAHPGISASSPGTRRVSVGSDSIFPDSRKGGRTEERELTRQVIPTLFRTLWYCVLGTSAWAGDPAWPRFCTDYSILEPGEMWACELRCACPGCPDCRWPWPSLPDGLVRVASRCQVT